MDFFPATNLEGLLLELGPQVVEFVDALADALGCEVALCHHLIARLADRSDSGLVVVDFAQDGLVFLHQVLNADQVTTCEHLRLLVECK